MELKTNEISNKSFPKKPYIKKGYYKGELVEVKPWADKDGLLKEGTYGRQIILLFKVYGSNGEVLKTSEGEPLILARKTYSEYKNDDGSYRSALTPSSGTTKLFEALGWKFNSKINTDEFIGKFVELNIDDYSTTYTNVDGSIENYKASSIKDVSFWNDEVQA